MLYLVNLKVVVVNLIDLVYMFRDYGLSSGIDGILKFVGVCKFLEVIKVIDLGISKVG